MRRPRGPDRSAGEILWLPPLATSASPGLQNHPILLLAPPNASQVVPVCLVTTLAGTSLADKYRERARRAKYLPLGAPHPDSGAVLACEIKGKVLERQSYVRLSDMFWVAAGDAEAMRGGRAWVPVEGMKVVLEGVERYCKTGEWAKVEQARSALGGQVAPVVKASPAPAQPAAVTNKVRPSKRYIPVQLSSAIAAALPPAPAQHATETTPLPTSNRYSSLPAVAPLFPPWTPPVPPPAPPARNTRPTPAVYAVIAAPPANEATPLRPNAVTTYSTQTTHTTSYSSGPRLESRSAAVAKPSHLHVIAVVILQVVGYLSAAAIAGAAIGAAGYGVWHLLCAVLSWVAGLHVDWFGVLSVAFFFFFALQACCG
ncbi:hypothetical protein EDC01DRAFT_636881 [Geopyxis carbonaria]|nr:hypothetical protein EDC01DRAFT_636881 [Geopyxis carbonaria]